MFTNIPINLFSRSIEFEENRKEMLCNNCVSLLLSVSSSVSMKLSLSQSVSSEIYIEYIRHSFRHSLTLTVLNLKVCILHKYLNEISLWLSALLSVYLFVWLSKCCTFCIWLYFAPIVLVLLQAEIFVMFRGGKNLHFTML